MRGRGLKLLYSVFSLKTVVAPHAGAWIGTKK